MGASNNAVHLGRQSCQIPPRPPLLKGGWGDLLERDIIAETYVNGIVLSQLPFGPGPAKAGCERERGRGLAYRPPLIFGTIRTVSPCARGRVRSTVWPLTRISRPPFTPSSFRRLSRLKGLSRRTSCVLLPSVTTFTTMVSCSCAVPSVIAFLLFAKGFSWSVSRRVLGGEKGKRSLIEDDLNWTRLTHHDPLHLSCHKAGDPEVVVGDGLGRTGNLQGFVVGIECPFVKPDVVRIHGPDGVNPGHLCAHPGVDVGRDAGLVPDRSVPDTPPCFHAVHA